MTTYDNLPVYKATYDLLLQLFRLCINMERDFKFTIGETLKKEVVGLIMNVYRANCRLDKLELLKNARENVEVIRLLFRLIYDLKHISMKEFISVSDKIELVSENGMFDPEGVVCADETSALQI
jgi:hypothetical protein